MVRWDFKIALLQLCHSQIAASRQLKIPQNRLSYIVQGHSEPTERERAILEKALGRDYFSKEDEGPWAA